MTKRLNEITLSTIAMPADANANGDIFGGWVMAQMDLAGSVPAKQIARNRIVTVAVDRMKFIKPVKVGDRVNCYAKLVKIGNSSVTVSVDVFAEQLTELTNCQVTEGLFTYVSIDKNGRPQELKKTNPKIAEIKKKLN